MPGSLLGNIVPRVEDPDLVRGLGTFVDNQRIDGTAHAVFVRSPFAHARITAVDTAEAGRAPGVLAVHTGASLREAIGDRPVPAFAEVNPAALRRALAVDRVRFVGDPVAMVVAETRAQAVDAAELVDVDYDELPVVADMEAALADGAPLQFEEIGSNVAASRADGDRTDPLAGADHVVRLRLENQRIATAPIEGHAILVEPRQDGLTVWVATQQPHMARNLIARFTGLEQDRVRVIAPHVGGAFGGKAGIIPDHAAVVAAARQLGRPVKWTETRSEAMLSMHGRGQVQYAELGLTAEGRMVGLRVRVVGDCGAYAGFGGALALGPTYMMIQGPYDVPEIRYDAIAALTNTARGRLPRRRASEAAALLERLIDLAADELDLAPEEIRRRNLIAPTRSPSSRARASPTTWPTSTCPCARPCGSLTSTPPAPSSSAAAMPATSSSSASARGLRGDHRFRRLGVRVPARPRRRHGHRDGRQPPGTAGPRDVVLDDRGRPAGIPMEDITYVQSDTALVRSGGGTGGSRSLQMGGNAVGQGPTRCGSRRSMSPPACSRPTRPTSSWMTGPSRCAASPAPGSAGGSSLPGRTSTTAGSGRTPTSPRTARRSPSAPTCRSSRSTPTPGWSRRSPRGRRRLRSGAQPARGRRAAARRRRAGHLASAVGAVSSTTRPARPLTSTFADYAMPTTADTINLEVSNTETPTPLNPLGAKGIGESATIGSTPAVQNAVVDALSHLGVRHVDLPCTPERVWRAIRDAASGTGQALWREPPAAFGRLPRGDDATTPDTVEI
nr:molybdopterin cofactor-binding domain-containing protein [Nocardioides ungokensis]